MLDMLFSPITINKTEIKNRIAYPSLGLLYSLDGKINDRYINFFKERARGGTGIVTVGPVGFDTVGSGTVVPLIGSDDVIPDFKKLTNIIQDNGSKAWIQLFHAGAYSYSKMLTDEDPIAPSPIYSHYSKSVPREMTIEDIKQVQENFVKAAERAREAGFDGVEIIGSAGYLITQFLSPLKNKRNDEYGGSFENRIRFPREIIEEMRRRLGPHYPISIRMAGNDLVPGSNTDLETPEIAKVYEKAGIDLINVTGGWHESVVPQLASELPRGGFAYLAWIIKKEVSIPVMASNRIPDPYLAEQILRDGIADMVNLGRVLIADPFWPTKAIEGRVDEIRPCVSCSQGCSDQVFSGRPLFCLANPRAGFEGEREIVEAGSPKNVMVIGAGPGGMEAAVTAAMAGHKVELYEKSDDIGGQLWIAGAPPHKHELWEFIRYYETMLDKYEIDVLLETEVTIDLIKERKPDYIIAAEGAEPIIPPIEGITGPNVVSAWDILRNDTPVGKRVAIIGGGAVGLETAEYLALKGTISPDTLYFLFKYQVESVERLRELMMKGTKEITVFEMLPKIGKDVGKSSRWVLLGSLEKHGVKTLPLAKVLSVKNNTVTFERGKNTGTMEFDTIVNAVGSKSVKNVSEKLDGLGIPYTVIGDSVRPAQINDAIHEGFLAALNIDKVKASQ